VRKGEVGNRLDAYYHKPFFQHLREKFVSQGLQYLKKYIASWNRGDGPRDGFYTDDAEEGVYFLRINNLKENSIDLTDVKLINRIVHDKTLKRSQVTAGDLVFAISGTKDNLGTVSIVPEFIKEANLNSAMVRLDLDLAKLDKKYFCLLFSLNFVRTQIDYIGKGAAQNNLNNEEICQIQIPVPPLAIQTQIVEKFENAYNAKRAKEAEAKELLAGIDAYLLDKLGIATPTKTAAKKTFYTTASKVTGGRLDPEYVAYQSQITSDKYPIVHLKQLLKTSPQYGANESGIERTDITQPRYIRITDIDEIGRLDETDLGKTALTIEERYILQNNDLLFARSGNTVGKCYLHKSDLVNYECFFAGYMIRFILNDIYALPEFIFGWTQTQLYKDWVTAIRRAAGQPNINAEEYKSLQIPLPPLEIQNEIATHIQNLREKAKRLEMEANSEIEQAKIEVERMILGE
jgi:restriction endonuclease S subunit